MSIELESANKSNRRNVPIPCRKKFGMLEVLERTEKKSSNGAYLYRCRCDCGGEKLVTASELQNGKGKSCGCLKKRIILKTGQRIGKLTVKKQLEKGSTRGKNWICKCDCGNLCEIPGYDLLNEKRTSCGKCPRFRTTSKDITGVRYGSLTALYPTDNRYDSSIVWHYVCDCGNMRDVSVAQLESGQYLSCGCLQNETRKKTFSENIHFVDGTCIERIASEKLAKNNTSGVKGVYLNTKQKRWIATIGVSGYSIYLGSYKDLNDAAEARRKAEEIYHKPILKKFGINKNKE